MLDGIEQAANYWRISGIFKNMTNNADKYCSFLVNLGNDETCDVAQSVKSKI